MTENYIFSGYGHALGEYSIDNKELEQAVDKEFLEKFDTARIEAGEKFQKAKAKQPKLSAFDYMAELKMGFKKRNHVVPFPPTREKYKTAKTSLDLAVDATQNAIADAGINPEDISAWLVSTATPHEQAPGIAATIKTHFVDKNNLTPAFTLTSGCSGFNLNLERALEYLQVNKDAKHVVVAHTETMSSFLTEKSKFVSFVTFGDGAGAIILSKVDSDRKEGLLAVENFQDLKMIDFVGVDKTWNLYMGESIIKDRAIINLVKSSKNILKKSNWSVEDIDLAVPHQTGNAILIDTAKQLELPLDKMYLEAQRRFGNVSGSTVLLSLSLLNKEDKLKEGMKLLSAAAGVGGKYGSFTYLVSKKQKKAKLIKNDLKNKKVLVLGATGGLGSAVVKELDSLGADILVQYRSEEKLQNLKKELPQIESYFANLSDNRSIDKFVSELKKQYSEIDYLIVVSGVSGALSSALDVKKEDVKEVTQLNFSSVVKIYQALFENLKETVVFVGSAAEDAQFSGSSAYVSAKRSLHGFAASASWEAFSKGLRMVYYMPGIVETGMTEQLNPKQVFMARQQINQEEKLTAKAVAERIVKSLYLINVNKVDDSFENIMTVRRDGYFVTDGRW